MKVPYTGAIDCDVHPAIPKTAVLLPYLDDFWRDQITNRYIDKFPFAMTSFPPNSPLMCRPDWRREGALPGADFKAFQTDALDAFGTSVAICNVFHGSVTLFNEDMAAAFTSAVNKWTKAELLDRDPRLRASILVTPQNVTHALAEIERCADDKRFVQILLLAQNEVMLGRRSLWPIYEACEKHGLAVGIHAGGMYRTPTTGLGFPSYQVEDYVVQATAFQSQLVSIISEGVFARFPDLKVVMIESGFSWLPTWMWRMNKTWRGARPETPWVDRFPSEIVKDHVRFTLQPFDTPDDPALIQRLFEHVGSDDLVMFSTDYPHWQFDEDNVLPNGLSDTTIRKILIDTAMDTYPRLRETAGANVQQVQEASP